MSAEAGKYSRTHEDMKAFQEWTELWAREVFRVLKPGAHALVFCSPRSYHRMACGLEDAGFEIRDQIQWLFGSGFPKSLDVSKAIDKMHGAEREIVGRHPRPASSLGNDLNMDGGKARSQVDITAPSTPDAIKWQGWGTALKPANEPICLARKPLSEDTVAKNVLKWGTGGLNIDGCRIGTDNVPSKKRLGDKYAGFKGNELGENLPWEYSQGRFPSNLILSHSPNCTEEACDMFDCPVKGLDEQSGVLKQGGFQKGSVKRSNPENVSKHSHMGSIIKKDPVAPHRVETDTYGASRFFYCAKVSSRERNQGCDVVSIDPWETADLALLAENVEQLVKGISDTLVQFMADKSWSTDLYGHSISEQYPSGLMFTISTVIKLITELKTLRSSQDSNTKGYIQDALKTIEANGLSLVESAAFLNLSDRTTIRDETAAVLNASRALLNELLKINKIAKESEDGVGAKNVHPT